MSLVNDMLRDLDQRRSGTPGAGLGAEKLIPFTTSLRSRSGVKMVFGIAVLVMLAGIVTMLGLQYFREPIGIPLSSMESHSANATLSLVVPVSGAADAEVAEATAEEVTPEQMELAMIAKRMEELEAQNRSLLQAQAQMLARNSTDESIAGSAIPVGLDSLSADSQLASGVQAAGVAPLTSLVTDSPAVDPAFADALAVDPAVVSEQELDAAHAAADQVVSQEPTAPMRSPTEMSFQDQDKAKTQEALTLWSRNQRPEAVTALQSFIDANPQAHQSRETLAKLMLQQNDFAAVTVLVQEGLSVSSDFVGYRKLQARLMLGSGQAREAANLLVDKAPSVSVDSEYHDLLATAQLSSMDFGSAAKSYEALVQQNRNEARWWYGLAAAWDGQGRKTDAVQAYEQALNLPSLSAGLRQRSQQRVAELGL
jgi:MSHA biogenesis protein MshN